MTLLYTFSALFSDFSALLLFFFALLFCITALAFCFSGILPLLFAFLLCVFCSTAFFFCCIRPLAFLLIFFTALVKSFAALVFSFAGLISELFCPFCFLATPFLVLTALFSPLFCFDFWLARLENLLLATFLTQKPLDLEDFSLLSSYFFLKSGMVRLSISYFILLFFFFPFLLFSRVSFVPTPMPAKLSGCPFTSVFLALFSSSALFLFSFFP